MPYNNGVMNRIYKLEQLIIIKNRLLQTNITYLTSNLKIWINESL